MPRLDCSPGASGCNRSTRCSRRKTPPQDGATASGMTTVPSFGTASWRCARPNATWTVGSRHRRGPDRERSERSRLRIRVDANPSELLLDDRQPKPGIGPARGPSRLLQAQIRPGNPADLRSNSFPSVRSWCTLLYRNCPAGGGSAVASFPAPGDAAMVHTASGTGPAAHSCTTAFGPTAGSRMRGDEEFPPDRRASFSVVRFWPPMEWSGFAASSIVRLATA